MKKTFFLFLFVTGILSASDSSDSVSVIVSSKHASDRPSMTAERVLVYLLGERPSDEVVNAFAERLRASIVADDSVKQLVSFIDSSDSSDSADDIPTVFLKKMIVQTVTDVLQGKHLEALDARLQLQMREKAMREQRYKMYAAFGTTITSVCGLITTVVAYNLS